MKTFKKGTVRFLNYNNWEHLYVKLDDEDFGWWRLENLSIAPEKREMRRLTTEQVESENHFQIMNAHGICVDLSSNKICIITDKKSSSYEVYVRKTTEHGISCKSWLSEKDFLNKFFPIPY
jgi:mevalonate pyrophosphate decarboxylase